MTPPNPAARIAEIRERLEASNRHASDAQSLQAPQPVLDLYLAAPADLRYLLDELERVRGALEEAANDARKMQAAMVCGGWNPHAALDFLGTLERRCRQALAGREGE